MRVQLRAPSGGTSSHCLPCTFWQAFDPCLLIAWGHPCLLCWSRHMAPQLPSLLAGPADGPLRSCLPALQLL